MISIRKFSDFTHCLISTFTKLTPIITIIMVFAGKRESFPHKTCIFRENGINLSVL